MNPTPRQAEHIKWVQFAILLSQVDFTELTEGQRLDLKNDFHRFLRSMDPPKESLPEGFSAMLPSLRGLRLKKRHDALEFVGEEDVDESRAKSILNTELENLTGPAKATATMVESNVSVTHAIVRTGDSFYYWTFPRSGHDRIVALLGHHLGGSGILPSMLGRCPKCQKIFIASRKPRPDRKFHCSRLCSGNAASRAYRDRKKKLEKAKRLIAAGRSIKKAAEIVKADLAWLKSELGNA